MACYLFPPLAAVGDFVRGDAKVCQDFGDSSGVHSAVGSHVGLAASVDIHLADYKKTRKRTFTVLTAYNCTLFTFLIVKVLHAH